MAELDDDIPTAKSVSDFIRIIKDLSPTSDSFFTYRGQRNVAWDTNPGILRPDRENLLRHERDAVRELVAVHPQEFRDDQSMFDRLVRMQHFNLPTRLLDVTTNPLVALYFAAGALNERLEDPADGAVSYISVPKLRRKYFDSDTISCVANAANLSDYEKEEIRSSHGMLQSKFNQLDSVQRLLQFVRVEKPYFLPAINGEELRRVWYVVPKLNNRRIIAQSGAFLIFGIDIIRVMKFEESIHGRLIIVPHNAKALIREELDTLGINQRSLFPEIDRAAEYIVAKFSG